jgi:hypothetical protein
MASVTPITAAAPVRPKFLHESTAIEMYKRRAPVEQPLTFLEWLKHRNLTISRLG